tara:strand:- start:1136 stop:1867 length:732 start_codon:yes stop_codon:yes gene_type:complete
MEYFGTEEDRVIKGQIEENIRTSTAASKRLKLDFGKEDWLDTIKLLSESIPRALEPVHHFERTYSQYQEDLILNEIFESKGTTNKFMVDIGAGNGIWISNSLFFRERGWKCLMIDGEPGEIGEQIGVQKHWVTRENINNIFKDNNVPTEPDLLSLDMDGNDYHLLKEIFKEFKPRVVIAEINIFFENRDAYMEYNENYNHHKERIKGYGQSVAAAYRLGKENGYRTVSLVENTNIILVREDVI